MDFGLELDILGGRDYDRHYHVEVLEYSNSDSDGEGEWINVGKMSEKRSYLASSIIDFEKFKDHCQPKEFVTSNKLCARRGRGSISICLG